MAKALVIVESPAKAKTINKYLGKDFKVIASMGHVRDLPKNKLGVDVESGFRPDYVVLPDRVKIIKALKEAAADATEIYVATDPDREGEAIGWHLAEELGASKRKVRRLMFNEITKKAVLDAVKHPGKIDMKMVDAQQARRVLDRLVGYKISPILWDKVRRGLSAGRVQSVALKLVCDREREIEQFVPEEFWHLFARLAGPLPPEFEAKLLKKNGDTIKVSNQEQSSTIVADLEGATWTVTSVAQKEKRRFAPPPFTTSKLQQAGYNRLRYTARRTMMLAQRLYEGIELGDEGSVALITYMRTDSVRVSADAITQVRDHIGSSYGQNFLPEKPNVYKSKKDAQEAHEAIRPTDVTRTPESVKPYLDESMWKLYLMIWQRFVASQMVPAIFDQTTVDVAANDYTFR